MKFILFLCISTSLISRVEVGLDRIFTPEYFYLVQGKRVGLVTNHTGKNKNFESNIDLFSSQEGVTLSAVFTPEHGIDGNIAASEEVKSSKRDLFTIFSIYGDTKKPTKDMLKGIDVLVYDMQDIGVRSYTYISTMCLVIESAKENNIPCVVLDRPNPLSGNTIDGLMLQKQHTSFVGYVRVPYCYGMTPCELAYYFNSVNKVNCNLYRVPMKGWKRSMHFSDTGLVWEGTSPYVPEELTPLYCATTGIIGELSLVSIGIGYTSPFRYIAAPWIDAKKFAGQLNKHGFKGVHFSPVHYTPQHGLYANQLCHGISLCISDKKVYKPCEVHALLLGTLKQMYGDKVKEAIEKASEQQKRMFVITSGSKVPYDLLMKKKYIIWPLITLMRGDCESFAKKREFALMKEYDD